MAGWRAGGLAEYLSLDAAFVLDASGLTFDEAAMVEFLSIGYHAVQRAHASAGLRVLVVGAGPIGMAIAIFAKLRGTEITMIDSNAQRVRFCQDVLGVSAAQASHDASSQLIAISDNDGFDVVFDATGNPAAMIAGFGHVAHGGTYVLVSVVSADITFSDPEFHKREMSLLGSRNATIRDFDAVIDAVRTNQLPVAAMHTHSAALEKLPETLPTWMLPETGVIKAIVEI